MAQRRGGGSSGSPKFSVGAMVLMGTGKMGSSSEMVITNQVASIAEMANTVEMTNQTQALNTGDGTWLMARLLAAFMLVGLVNYLLPWLFGSNRKNSWYRIVGDGVFLLFFLV